MTTTLILGGPGCGKTTKLLSIIDEHLTAGVPPHRIGYVTFTRKAAHEGLSRAVEKFHFLPDDLPYFRTLHSLAFKQLALQPEAVIDNKAMRQFEKWAGLKLSKAPDEDNLVQLGFTLKEEDDRALAAISMSRLTGRPLRDVCRDLLVLPRNAERINEMFETFKEERSLLDFTDMLEQYSKEGVVPVLDVLIVDEAQDLNRLQWRIVERLKQHAAQVYIAGDDDQAIYEWAGADVEYFQNIEGERIVLPISYRLNTAVFGVVERILKAIDARYEKDWKPNKEGGVVRHVLHVSECDLSQGSWYILARSAYSLYKVKKYLTQMGWPYFDGTRSSVDNDDVRSVLLWERLRKGKEISGVDVQLVYSKLKKKSVAHGFKQREYEGAAYTINDLRDECGLLVDGTWMEVLSLAPHTVEHIREIKRRGESLTKPPRITVSTIHGVKGGEADHVLLITEISKTVSENLHLNRAAEARVFYVAASRAKESLHLQIPQAGDYYPIGRKQHG
jgi:DNA helicase-2/ATP-dependent DNA helicase PcrA